MQRSNNSSDIKENSILLECHLHLSQPQDKGEHEVFAISDGVVACPKPAYRSYPERWWLLLTVVLLNLANYSHWVAFPSVTKESCIHGTMITQPILSLLYHVCNRNTAKIISYSTKLYKMGFQMFLFFFNR